MSVNRPLIRMEKEFLTNLHQSQIDLHIGTSLTKVGLQGKITFLIAGNIRHQILRLYDVSYFKLILFFLIKSNPSQVYCTQADVKSRPFSQWVFVNLRLSLDWTIPFLSSHFDVG